MPARGTPKKHPKQTPYTHLKLPVELYAELETMARENGLINPRNREGNRTKLIEEMIVVYRTKNRPNEVKVGALSYPVKWVERYTLLQPGCISMHRISQNEIRVKDVISSDFVPLLNPAPGVYIEVIRAHGVHYIHESDISHVRIQGGEYVEKLTPCLGVGDEIDQADYWVMSYSHQVLLDILPNWVKSSERTMVNHIRHYHSNYDRVLDRLVKPKNYSRQKYLKIFAWFNNEISKQYPDLESECQQQIKSKMQP